jgi:DNA-binding MarR family transcriptional regulator
MATGNEDDRPELDRLHEAVYEFASAERVLRARYRRAAGSLSPGRVQALNVLLRESEMTPGALARAAALRPNSITAMLEQLEQIGLIRRRQDDTDRRVWWISLTEQGRAQLAELQRQWKEHFADAFASTSNRDLLVAARVLERLADVFANFDVERD